MRTSDAWASDLRMSMAFWAIALVLGAYATYTTRYFINGDAIAYAEIAEGIRTGHWSVLANVTYSPGYPAVLALGQVVLGTTALDEVYLLKWVNFLIFCVTLIVLELFLARVGRRAESERLAEQQPNTWPIVKALCHAMFLIATLEMVRIQAMTPDMLIFAIVLTCMTIIVWIREDPRRYSRYALLGIALSLGYLCKEVYWTFSVVFLFLAGLCAASFRQGFPRILLALFMMLAVAAPLIGARSYKLGRLSHGELGRFAYAHFISGEGEPVKPEVVHRSPDFLRYESEEECALPHGFDHCYWYDGGIKPRFDLRAHVAVIKDNLLDLGKQNRMWMFNTGLFFGALGMAGFLRFGLLSPSLSLVLLIVPAIFGIGLYCLVHMEPRYVAPFFLLGFVAVAMCFRWPKRPRIAPFLGWVLVGVFILGQLSVVVRSVAQQATAGLVSDRGWVSHRDRFLEQVAVREFLLLGGVKRGDKIGLVGEASVYWARMGGVRVTVEARNKEEFINCTQEQRSEALRKLERGGLKAVVAHGADLASLASEGWKPVPGSSSFFVKFLGGGGDRPDRVTLDRVGKYGLHSSGSAFFYTSMHVIHKPRGKMERQTRERTVVCWNAPLSKRPYYCRRYAS